jgi:WD40 repeat protein
MPARLVIAPRRVTLALAAALLVLLLLLVLAGAAWRASAERVLDAGGPVSEITFTSDGEHVAAITNDGLLRAWSVATGALDLERRFPDASPALPVAISPALDSVAIVSSPARLQIYSMEGALLAHPVVTDEISGLSFSSDGRALATREVKGTICVWSLPEGTLRFRIEAAKNGPFLGDPSLSSTGELLTSGRHSRPRLWSSSGHLLRELGTQELGFASCSGNGETIAVTDEAEPQSIGVFSARDGALVSRFQVDDAFQPRLSESGDLVAVSVYGEPRLPLCDDGRFAIFAVREGRRLATLPATELVFSPRTATLAWKDGSSLVHVVPLDRLGRWRHLRGGP